MMKSVAVALMLATCTLGAPQERKGLSDEEIRELTTKGETPLEIALRCGLFFAGEIGAPPIERLFVFNATWEAPECPTTEPVPRFTQFCSTIWKKLEPGLDYEKPSINKKRAAEGKRMGDDICNILLRDYKVPFVGSKQNSKRYPNGLKLGMYANGCGNLEWLDTGFRFKDPVCCIKGTYDKC